MRGRELLDALAFCALTVAVACALWRLVPSLGIPIIVLVALAVARGALSAAYRMTRGPAPLPIGEHQIGASASDTA